MHKHLFIVKTKRGNIFIASCAKKQLIITVRTPKCLSAVHNAKKITYCTFQQSISSINSSALNFVSQYNNYSLKTGTQQEVLLSQSIIWLLFTLFLNINHNSKFSTVKLSSLQSWSKKYGCFTLLITKKLDKCSSTFSSLFWTLKINIFTNWLNSIS